jgi:hypothetical protein
LRVGQSPFSGHQAGMSALWHDVDYVPEQRFETPTVEKGLEDMALPGEQHQLPDGVDDPFKRLDEVYDVAAQQMERGIRGANFLHGKVSASNEASDPRRIAAQDPAAAQHLSTQRGGAVDNKIVESVRTDLEQVRMTNQAAAVTVPKAKSATKTAADAESQSAATGASNVGDALGAAAMFIPMAAGQAISSVAQGPLPALATQAVTVTSAVVAAGQVTAAGVAEGLKEDEPVVVRRGLARKQQDG